MFNYTAPSVKKVIIQTTDYNNVPKDTNDFYAYKGFEKLGYDIILKPFEFFNDYVDDAKEFIENLPFEDIACVCGNIGYITKVLEYYNKPYPEGDDYPRDITFHWKFVQRFIIREPIKKVMEHIEGMFKDKGILNTGIFIKPVQVKSFYGMPIRNKKDFSDFKILCLRNPKLDIEKDDCYWCEALNIVSEWRNYVLNGQLLDSKHYRGNFRIHPDYNVIDEMIKAYTSSPKTYALDTGVTAEGQTILIEVNRVDALGNYGLNETDYATMMEVNWKQVFHE